MQANFVRQSLIVKSRRGFTIVELLIVIVVIAILAAISIVAYSGVQQRANNVENTALAKAFSDAITLYVTNNGSYPPGSGDYHCLGNGTNDADSDGQYDCLSDGVVALTERNAAFDTAMAPYVNAGMAAANFTISDTDGKKFMGAQYWIDPDALIDGQSHIWYLYYIVQGQGTCDYGKVLTDTGWPNYSSTRPAGGYTWQETGGRGCVIPLPKPGNL